MAIRIVRLGTPRAKNEGLRIGTVRRPPRGVPKAKFASEDWYDVWFPNLAPSVATMKLGLGVEFEDVVPRRHVDGEGSAACRDEVVRAEHRAIRTAAESERRYGRRREQFA